LKQSGLRQTVKKRCLRTNKLSARVSLRSKSPPRSLSSEMKNFRY
jgi:hypothetical protein